MLVKRRLFGFVARESGGFSWLCLPRSCEYCIVPCVWAPGARGPDDLHLGPMICVWAAPPTCMSRGLRADRGVDAHTQGLTCERTMWLSGRYHPGQAPDNAREQPIPPRTAHNADHFATSSPLSAFFTEVV